MTRKLIPLFALVTLLGIGALGAGPALALPCNPDTDPDCDPGGGPTTTTVQVDLDVALPTAGTVTDAGGQISCGADCHGDYSYIKTCEDFECTTSSVDLVTLNASGAPAAGYSGHFTYCRTSTAGTACTGPATDCGFGSCNISMDRDYRATLEWLDTTAPTKPTVTGPGAAGPAVRHFTAGGSTDNAAVTQIRFYLDDVDQGLVDPGSGYDAPIESLTNGTVHTITARSRDAAGNESDLSDAASFTVDRSAAVSITSPADGGHFQAGPTFNFDPDDDGSQIVCETIKGASDIVHSSPCSTSYATQPNGDGDYRFRVTFTDAVGNQATAERSFKIDTGDPNVTVTSPAPDQHVKSPVTPVFTASDGGTPVAANLVNECKLETDADFGGCGARSVPDGAHTLTVRVTDEAGNDRVVSVAFVADSTGPQVTVSSGPPEDAIIGTPSATYGWNATDASPPLAQTCKVDAGASTACSSPKTVSGLSEGSHTFTLKVTDALGNATEVTREVFVNAVRPSAAITNGPGEGDVVKTRDVTFGFSASGGAVSCSLDSETAFRACSAGSSDALRGLADGAHTFRVRVIDESDDSVVRSRTFRVDTSVAPPPIKEILKQILNPTLGTGYKAFKRYTVYRRLVVKGVPAGATVSVSCKGKKCPARSFKKTRAGNVKLSKFVKKKLRPGTKLTIRVTRDGSIGKQFVIRIRKAKAPKLSISQIA